MANKNTIRVDLNQDDLNEVLLMLIKLGLQADQRKRKAPAGEANTNQGSPITKPTDDFRKDD